MADNIIELRSREQIREEAAVWLVRLQEGLLDARKRELAVWLEEDRAHGDALVKLATLWDEMHVLTELSALFPLPADLPARGPRKFVLGASAAALAVLLGAAAWFGLNPFLPRQASAPPVYVSNFEARYGTAIGEQSTVNLPDGSVMLLNTNTRIAVRYTNSERRVDLIFGEGHFDVAWDSSRPFVVVAGTNSVRAVGTAFSVMISDQDDLEVAVVEGKVAVYSPRVAQQDGEIAIPPPLEETTLVAGESVTIRQSTKLVRRPDESNLAKRLAWHNGMVLFEDDELDTVISELGRYTTKNLILADESLGRIRVAGYFRAGDMEALLFALRENFHIGSRREGDNDIVLFRL